MPVISRLIPSLKLMRNCLISRPVLSDRCSIVKLRLAEAVPPKYVGEALLLNTLQFLISFQVGLIRRWGIRFSSKVQEIESTWAVLVKLHG